jgi:hypothetical protein
MDLDPVAMVTRPLLQNVAFSLCTFSGLGKRNLAPGFQQRASRSSSLSWFGN